MRIEDGVKLDFKDVLIRPKRSTIKSRSDVEITRTFTFKHSKRVWKGVPVMASNMDTTGTFEMAVELAAANMVCCIHKHYSVADWKEFASTSPDTLPYVAVSAGTADADFLLVQEILKEVPDVPMICLDVANGYSEHFVEAVKRFRLAFPSYTIIAGNVVTGEMTEELILSGADIVKVGIGPGSVCTTRMQTGIGYPQLSAVIECADAAHGLGGHIISDGGCTSPGDIAKAFGGGADFVMLGGMFAGHDESGGSVVEIDGEQFKEFYGMSSADAMKKHAGGVAEYRSSEGKSVRIKYVGAGSLKELAKRTTFIRVTQQLNEVFGRAEGHSMAVNRSDTIKKRRIGD